MKKSFLFAVGLIVGMLLTTIYFKYFHFNGEPYFVLQSDYKIEGAGVGYLKRGTLLRFDQGMNEGFDRFIFYLNIKGGNLAKVDPISTYEIHPYWLDEDNGK